MVMDRMELEVELKVDKTVTSLAGNRYGREIYRSQIKEKIRDGVVVKLQIPDQIEDVASSFIQGLFSELAEKVGKENARNMLILNSNHLEIMEKIDFVIDAYGVL